MKEPSLTVRLRGDSRHYQPGQVIRGEYRLDIADIARLKSVEVSILWYTEGKGDEDLGIHFFERTVCEKQSDLQFESPVSFETELPLSPLSYDGVIVRIHWCARVRMFLSRGRQIMAEQPFILGEVPAAQVVEQNEDVPLADDQTPKTPNPSAAT